MKYAPFLIVALSASTLAATLDPSKIEDKVDIKLGEKLTVQFEVQGHSLKKPKIVERPDPKRPNLTLDFGKHGEDLILHIQNPFPQSLQMRCLMRLKGQQGYVETNILSIPAKVGDFEGWRDPIEELVLFDFRLSK
jgi:hypothetical protein